MVDPKAAYQVTSNDMQSLLQELNMILARISERLDEIQNVIVSEDELNIKCTDDESTVIHQLGD